MAHARASNDFLKILQLFSLFVIICATVLLLLLPFDGCCLAFDASVFDISINNSSIDKYHKNDGVLK